MDALSDQGVVFWGRRYAARLVPSGAWAVAATALIFGSATALLIRPELVGWREVLPAFIAGGGVEAAMLIAGIAWASTVLTVFFVAAQCSRRANAAV
jgi:hypothetical protein